MNETFNERYIHSQFKVKCVTPKSKWAVSQYLQRVVRKGRWPGNYRELAALWKMTRLDWAQLHRGLHSSAAQRLSLSWLCTAGQNCVSILWFISRSMAESFLACNRVAWAPAAGNVLAYYMTAYKAFGFNVNTSYDTRSVQMVWLRLWFFLSQMGYIGFNKWHCVITTMILNPIQSISCNFRIAVAIAPCE